MSSLYVRVAGVWKLVDFNAAGTLPNGPLLQNLVTTVTTNTLTVTFNTDTLAWRVIRWGTDPNNLASMENGTAYRTSHFIQLYNLTPATTYYYQLTLTDETDNVTVSQVYSIATETVAGGVAGPVVSALSVVPASSSVAITFNTDVSALRVIQWGTTAGNLSNSETGSAYRTAHSITLYDLLPSTTYYYQLQLTNAAGDGITTTSVQSFVTTVAQVVVPGTSLLRWAPPTLVNPVSWTPTSSDRNRTFSSSQDVIIVAPSTPIGWKDGIIVSGGRNIVSMGLEFEFNTNHYGSTLDASLTNRCVRFNGGTGNTSRVIHLEGWKMHGTELFEGINHDGGDETNTTIRLQNIYSGRIRWRYPPGATSGHHGGDFFQPWDGPYRLQVDYVTAVQMDYQCFWLQPRQFYTGPLTRWDFSHVDIIGSGDHAQLFAMNGGEPSAADRVLDQVYVQPGNRSWSQSIKGEWINLKQGRPSGGSFVDPNTVGIGYVSPGYL